MMSRSRPSKFLALKLVVLAAICSVGLIAMPAAASAATGTCVVYGPEGGAPLTDNSITVVAGSSTELRLSCVGSENVDTYTVDNTNSTGYFNAGAGSNASIVTVSPSGSDLIGDFIASSSGLGQYQDSFVFTANNADDAFPNVTVNVFVNPAPPVCTITNSADDNQNVVQGTEAVTHVAFTCTDNGDGPAFFSGPVQGEHGLFSTDSNGTTVDYVANAHDSGADTVALIAHTANSGYSEPLFFHYTVTDATPTCTPVNETLQGGQDADLTFSFEPRCSDADDTLTYRAADGSTGAQGTYGYLSLTDNEADYREDSSAAANLTAPVTETFQVEVVDGNPDHVVTVPVTITINPDHAPVCTTVTGDDNQSVVHGNNSITIGIVCADPDSNVNPGDAFFAVDLDQDALPTQGNASINDAQNEITYTSNYEGLGSDTIAVVASGNGGATSSTLLIHVHVTDNAPACADASLAMTNDSSDGADLACTDADGDYVSYDVGQAPLNGTVFQSGSFFYYVPNDGFVGTDTFTVLADDDAMQTPITVTAHVTAAPPVVVEPVITPVLTPAVPVAPVVTPPVVVPPVVVVTPPAPKLSSPVTVKGGVVTLALGCADATATCKASVGLSTVIAGKTVSLGTKAITIKPGKDGALKVTLSGAAKKALAAFAGKTITVKVAVKTTNPKTGTTTTATKAVKVKVPR